jgi:hypothetical protein
MLPLWRHCNKTADLGIGTRKKGRGTREQGSIGALAGGGRVKLTPNLILVVATGGSIYYAAKKTFSGEPHRTNNALVLTI